MAVANFGAILAQFWRIWGIDRKTSLMMYEARDKCEGNVSSSTHFCLPWYES